MIAWMSECESLLYTNVKLLIRKKRGKLYGEWRWKNCNVYGK